MASTADWDSLWNGARWIWASPPPKPPALGFLEPQIPSRETWNRWCVLRRSFRLDAVPTHVPARMTGDSRYVAYLNGEEIARGPARSAPPRLTYAERDLSKGLRVGFNVISVMVRFYGHPTPWWLPRRASQEVGYGGFLFEAPAIEVVSNGDWRTLPEFGEPDTYDGSPDAPVAEVRDATRIPAGWAEVDFDDSAWGRAVELAGGDWLPEQGHGAITVTTPWISPDNLPTPTTIPVSLQPIGDIPIAPSDATDPVEAAIYAIGFGPETDDSPRPEPGPDGVTLKMFDAGGITVGTPWVRVKGVRGALVDLLGAEELRPDGTAELRPRRFAARYRLAGDGIERFESFERVGCRFVGAIVRGEAEILEVGAVERRHPRSGHARFECDDADLVKLWEAGARTLDVCSLDTLVDCPGREQRTWVGDAYVENLVSFVVNEDHSLIRRTIEVCAESLRGDDLLSQAAAGDVELWAQTIPDYSLHWVRSLARYAEYTADLDFVADQDWVARRILNAFERYRGRDGFLAAVPGYTLIDWAWIRRDPWVAHPLDALYCLALTDHANLLETRGVDPERVAWERNLAAQTRLALRRLWDPDRGILQETPTCKAVSQHMNALGVLCGTITASEASRALAYTLDPSRYKVRPQDELHLDRPELVDGTEVLPVEPFFGHFVHQALALAGERDKLLSSCRRWGPMLASGNGTLDEFWGAPRGHGSRAHAWSATPTYDLTTHVLGLRPTSPGYSTAVLDPHLGSLEHLAGEVPTPHGPVRVELDTTGGHVEVPDGVELALRGMCDPAEVGPGRHDVRF